MTSQRSGLSDLFSACGNPKPLTPGFIPAERCIGRTSTRFRAPRDPLHLSFSSVGDLC